ncbi:hypothetical protein McpSp1_14410 [Methanocorpusculaceae archaeon Sp1]|nr:hypothetical protein [Methanocorpusculaceae archaeon Sp1]
MTDTEFAIIGCPKCRRMQVASLLHATKTCACGYKIDLSKVKLLRVCGSADEAGELLRSFAAPKNSGFVSASTIGTCSASEFIAEKKND